MRMPDRKRFDSWGEIAQYLRRDVTTVKRWEREKGLPVHRLPGGKRQAVFAYQDEIDDWSSGGKTKGIPTGVPEERRASDATPPSEIFASSSKLRKTHVAVAIAIFLAGAVLTPLFFIFEPDPQLRVARYVPLTSDVEDKGGPLFTDGVRVYFPQKSQTGLALAAIAVDGGGTGLISLPKRYETIYDLSPLRSELLSDESRSDQKGGDLWIIPLIGGSPRRIGNLRASAANWSPDGRQIAFILEKSLFLSNADGTQVRKLADLGREGLWLRWSPNGHILRFTSDEHHSDEVWQSLWEIGADGKNLHRLLEGWNSPPRECCGMWTPDGRFFIFEATREGRTDLWALPEQTNSWKHLFRRDAGTPVRLSSGLQGYLSPLVNFDGKRIFAVGIEKRGELVRYDSTMQNFAPFLGGISATWVTFSKSGHSVAYISYPEQTLWRANADGSKKEQITFAPLQVDGFDWSPDEKWFALRARTPGNPYVIYRVSSHGGEVQRMMPSKIEQGVPTWSPDGKAIAFGDVPEDFGKPSGWEAIHVFDLKTQKLSEVRGSVGLWTARWSPDGALLATLTIENQRLMLYDFTKQKWRATNAHHVNNLNWSRNSKYIYYDSTGDRALYRIGVADGQVEQLKSLRDYPNLAWWWSGLAPDGSPLILRNLGTNQIYSLVLESH